MASKRAVRRRINRIQCGRKQPYSNETRAVAAAIAATHQFQEHFRAYHCKGCGQWHIGHTKQGKIARALHSLTR